VTTRGRSWAFAARARGFSLLEVLVAFVILSLVATALFRLFSGALNNAAAADDYSRAVLVGESAIAEVAATRPLREGTAQGTADDGRIEWTTKVEPYVAPGAATGSDPIADTLPTRLFRVSAEVSFPSPAGGKRTLALATIRLAPREAR
jgi:general secretion pathway protein I